MIVWCVGNLEKKRGHPYRVLVKYKNTLPEPNNLRLCQVGASAGFCRPVFGCANNDLTNRSGRRTLRCTCEFSRFHSSSPPGLQAALSRSHPSGSRPGIRVPVTPRARPHPDTIGTRTASVPYPVQPMSISQDRRTGPTSCLTRRDAHPCVTQGTGERESIDI
jgi:hypothetical protein